MVPPAMRHTTNRRQVAISLDTQCRAGTWRLSSQLCRTPANIQEPVPSNRLQFRSLSLAPILHPTPATPISYARLTGSRDGFRLPIPARESETTDPPPFPVALSRARQQREQ